MTRINKMVMNGFKSFAKHTELIFNSNFNTVLGPNGSGKSVRADAKVLLANGQTKKIGELVDNALAQNQNIQQLDDGSFTTYNPTKISIHSLNPKTGNIEIKQVAAFIKRKGEPNLYTITTRTGKQVTTTACHPVMVCKDARIQSEVVGNLQIDQLIATPRKIQNKTTNIISKEFARALGYLIGDGYINRNRIEFVNSDDAIINDVKECFKSINIKFKYERKTATTTRLIHHSTNTGRYFCDLMGKTSTTKSVTSAYKTIPQEVLSSNTDTVASLLAALFDTDGYVGKRVPQIEYCSKSETLVDQIQLLLHQFGIVSIKKEKQKYATNTQKQTVRTYYSLFIYGVDNLYLFYKNIHLISKHKHERLVYWLTRKINTNPNLDVLPKETNLIIKDLKNTLLIDYKPLRKELPTLAAYIENRCNPTRGGIKRVLPVFLRKMSVLQRNLNNEGVYNTIKSSNIPLRAVASYCSLTADTISSWQQACVVPREKNVARVQCFLKEEIKARLTVAEQLLQHLQTLCNPDIYWDTITKIEKVKGEEWVYDLSIEENHNFVGNGIFVHNSNVLDALCFVLGKTSSKSLRAERASNLIYNGGKSRKPAKQGEVTIYFDNKNKTFPTQDQEIKVTRIVRQNGQSIYKINDQTRTRQEVVDLLAIAKINPDAHNIILQGDIIKFVEMSPVERRMLVEEIAGISIYEEKKGKALRELERVDERIKESEIILQERETYLKDLKKDRNQALKYKELNDKVQQNQATVYHLQIKRKEEELTDSKEKLESVTKKLKEVNDDIAHHRNKIKEKKDEIDSITKEVEERGEVGQVNLTKEIENLKIEITKHTGRTENCRAEIEKIKTRKHDLQNETENITQKIKGLKEEQKGWKEREGEAQKLKKEFRSKIDEFRKKHNLDDVTKIEEQIEQLDKKAETLQAQVNALREQQHNWLREKDVLEHMIKTADEKIDKVNQVASENKAQIELLKEMRTDFKKHTLDLNRRLDEDSTLVAKLTGARKEYQSLSEDVSKLEARAFSMREQSGQDRAIAEILDLKKTKKGIFGTVAELGEVSTKYALALEAAAGGRLRSIVVDTDATAAECIKYLKQRQSGRATFLPVNKMRGREEDPGADKVKGQGIHGKAIDLVHFDAKFKSVFAYVLGDTVIVDNIDVARKIGIGEHKMATIDGDIAERSGAMQGGFSQKRKGATGFREQEITHDLEKKQKALEEIQAQISAFESRRAENEEVITAIRTKKAELEGEIIKLEKSLHLEESDIDVDKKKKDEFKAQLKGVDGKLDAMQSQVMDANREMANIKIERQKLREQTVQLRSPSKLAELAAYEEQLRKATQGEFEASSKNEGYEKQITDMYYPELEKIKTLLVSLDAESAKFDAETKVLTQKLKEKNDQLEEKERQAKIFYAKFKSLFGDRNKLNDEVNVLEIKINGLVDASRQIEIKQNTMSLKGEESTNELNMLKELFKPFEGIPILENVSEQQLKSEITRFENMRNDIGSVNMRALEIYDEVEKEYNALLDKKSTLQKEKDDVLGLINEIEGRKKELFMKTFDMVQNNFKNIFASLSTKGEANLVLENPENPFAEGLRVSVRLTGNKFMDIRSLSGGEKTMTALAFIFAIQEHEPASFYVLDEVDAALDKHNSLKLAELVGKYAHRAQYIIISHNDGVISAADTLYGVSMNEHGMSTVVSLKI